MASQQEEKNDVSYGSEGLNASNASQYSRKTEGSSLKSLKSTSNAPVNMTQEVEELLHDLQEFSLLPKEDPRTEDFEEASNSEADQEDANLDDPQRLTLTTALIEASSTCQVCKLRLEEINALLQAAHKERQDAREWADNIRAKTNQWVQLQKQNNRNSYSQEQMERLVLIVQKQHIRMAELERALDLQASQIHELQQQQQQKPILRDRVYAQPTTTPFNTPARQEDEPLSPPPTVSPSHSENGRRNNTADKENMKNNAKYQIIETPHVQIQPPPCKQKKRQVFRTKDCQVIQYSNGAVREIYDNKQVVKFPNGDIQTIQDDYVEYYYKASNIVQIQYEDHVQYQFENGQIEEHYDDRKVVHFADGTTREYANASFAVTV